MASAPTSDDVELARAAAERPLAATHRSTVRRLSAADWTAGVVEEGGQFHRVLVLPGFGAVRMTRTAWAAERLPARMAVVHALATTVALPFAVPVPLTEVVGFGDGLAAVVQEYLPGGAHPPHTGDPAALRELCGVLAGIDTAPLEPHLGPPFAFRGPWTAEKVAAVQAVPRLLIEKHGAGIWSGGTPGPTGPTVSVGQWAGTVATLASKPPSLQILNWDLAAVWDPALNPAYLSLWHGEEKLESIARNAEEALRARVWLGWMALETIYDASLREGTDRPAVWTKLLSKALPRIQRAAAAEANWRAMNSPHGQECQRP